MTEAFSDTSLKQVILSTISRPSSQTMMSEWNRKNPQRGIPCTYCVKNKRPCRSLSTRLNCASKRCSQNGEPCSRTNEELFDRIKAARPHVLRSDFDAALKEIRADSSPRDTLRPQRCLLPGAPNSELDMVSTSTPSNGAGGADTLARPEIAPLAALPCCSEEEEEEEEETSSTEASILADPSASEQRILALTLEKDAAVATNAENTERMRRLEAAAAELQVVVDEKNALQNCNDILQAENAALQLEKDSVLAEKNSYEVHYNALKGEFDILQSEQGDTARRIAEDEISHSEVQVTALREELDALKRHAELLQAEKDASSARIADLERRVRSESDQRNVLQTRIVDLEAEIKTIENDSVRFLGTIKDFQNDQASSSDQLDHCKQHIDELESSNTKLSKALRGQERKLSATQNRNNKYQRSAVLQHLAISKLRDGLSSAYHATRDADNVNSQFEALARLCGVMSKHLAELKKLEIWLLEQTPMTYDEIVKIWTTHDYNVSELEDDAVHSNDGPSRAKKRKRDVD